MQILHIAKGSKVFQQCNSKHGHNLLNPLKLKGLEGCNSVYFPKSVGFFYIAYMSQGKTNCFNRKLYCKIWDTHAHQCYHCCQDMYSSNFIAFLKRKKNLQPLQLMQNAAAKILTHMRQMQMLSVTPVLKELHWTPLSKRKNQTDFKLKQWWCTNNSVCICWSSCAEKDQRLNHKSCLLGNYI